MSLLVVFSEVQNDAGGVCIASQVHCEKSVDSAGVEPKLLNALAETEKRRLILVTRLLQRLGIRTIIEEEAIPSVTMCHIYSTRSLVSDTDCKYEERGHYTGLDNNG